ncbi:cadherin domain-containing protein [Labilibaculum sp. K2S]|uniref:cadherin domain-containing protein n=1 Tax=Labilibaculum sp. K2S TaxID=3056386 RepID=UPI0025A4B5C5|nr:cadherin domain-containing protein [Labilibaculum sp. K2S]MDM8160382.1 cadherin domain-containing protein [Labilibaculum sp. K2S]
MKKIYIFTFHQQLMHFSEFRKGLSKLIMMFFLLASLLFVSGNKANAQLCTEISTFTNTYTSGLAAVGQSFTACASGVLSEIRVLGGGAYTGKTLTIYDGEGLGGDVLGTINSVVLHVASSISDFSIIDVSSANIAVINGNVYTFYFKGTDNNVMLIYYQAGSYNGQAYYEGIAQPSLDFYFEADIVAGSSNAAPTATAPSAPTVSEDDTNVALSDDIQVADTDGDNQTVTFTITGGTLTIGTTGITFGGSGNGNASFTAEGTLAAINTALDAATFTPTPNLSGTNAGTISFTTHDGTVASSAASVTFNITAINDDPSISGLPTDITVSEDIASNVDLSAATLSDVDAGSNSIVLTLTVSAGTLTASSGGSVTIGGSGTGTLSLTGAVANIDTYLNTASNIKYTGASNVNGNDAATLTLTANDGGYTGTGDGTDVSLGTVNVDITAANDDPSISGLPTDITVSEDIASNVDLSVATLSDVDAGSNSIVLTLTASAGTLTASSGGSVTISGSGTGTLSLTGAVANIDTYLNTASNIKYTGASNVNGNDAATLTLTANDGGYTGTGGGTDVSLGTVNVDISAVNDDPSISNLPTDIAASEDIASNVDLSAATLSDVDAGSNSIVLTLTASAGTLTASSGGSVTIGGSGTGTLSLTGAVANIDTYLNTASNIKYTSASNVNGNDAATLTLTANDGGYTGTGGGTDVSLGTVNVDITAANDDPSISGLPTDITVSEDIASNVDLSAATLSDIDAGANSIVLTITASAGTLTASSGGSVTIGGSGTGTLSLTGAVANIDTYLNTASNIKYTGASNVNGNDAATLTLTANDGGHTGSGGGTDVSLGTVNVDISAVNDKPTASNFTALSIYQNTPYAFAAGNFGYTDVDGDDMVKITVNSTPSNGILYLDADNGDDYDAGEELADGAYVSKANLDNGNLQYLNTNGTFSSFTFDVNDGTDYSASTYTATLTVTPEPTVTLSLDPSSSISENAGSTSVKATLSNTFNKTVSVNLLKSGTTSGTDYSLSSTSISITTGNTTGTATITGVNDDLDEDNETVIIDISSVTNGTESGTQQVTCTLTDDDNTPVITASQSFSIAENIVNSGAVGTVLATDGDAGTSFSDWTETGGTGASIFEINASTGAITVTDNSGIDYETTTSYTYTVTVSDGTNTSAAETITINITDVNDVVPIVTASQTFNIDEDASNTTSVGTVLATDGDVTATTFSSWTITDGNTNSVFDINSSTGEITVNDANELDYESITSYSLSITVSDGINTSTAETVVVDLEAINDETPVFTSASTINIDENTTDVITLTATDGDAGTTFTFSKIGGADQALFTVNSSTGALAFTSAPDYETPLDINADNDYIVQVSVSDGLNSSTQTITVSVDDVTGITITSNGGGATAGISIPENNTSIATVISVNEGVDIPAYSLVGGADQAKFNIHPTSGVLTLVSAPDYESAQDAGGNNSYEVIVRVTGDGGATDDQTITVTITDINDVTPVITASQSFSVDENVANTTSVGTVVATDGDVTATIFSNWTITAGNGAGVFAINSSTGEIIVTDNTALDYETTTSYNLSITVSDGTNTSAAETITINITDINDIAPVTTASQSFSIAENIANSGAVGTVLATDGDVGTSFSDWTETGGTGASIFEINASSGAITVTDNSTIDRESTASYTYTVTVSDGTNTSAAETITINITDVNDAVPIVTASQTFNIDEDASNATSVGTVLATDADVTATTFSSWTITAGNTNSVFAINSSTGEITVNDANELDYESITSYSLSITVSDGINTSATEAVTVDVNAINDNDPIVTASQSFDITENIANSGAVGTVLATDGDAGTSFSAWTETGGTGASIFEINASTGAITVTDNSGIDYETTTSYTYTVTVSDGLNNSAAETITINIIDINDNTPVVTSTQSFSIAEDIANSGIVGTVLATDGDAGTSFSSWTETGGTGASIFEINASTGAITVTDNSGIDYETTTSYSYTVTVSDGINTSAAEIITINITDINDVIPVITASQSFSVNEDASNTTSVGTVLATDGDASLTTYSSWTITGGNADGIFSVNSTTGEITVTDNTNLDYETTTSYSLTITVSDGIHTSSVEIVIININDRNENAPTAIQLSNTTIAENSAIGTEVGILTASDADVDETFTFNLAENEYFELDGDRIISKEIFNYEDYISYSLKVTVTDRGGLSYDDRFTIHIENQNETPEFLSEPVVQATVGDMYVYNMEYEDVDEDGCSISVIEKPDWLSVEDHGNGSFTLSGIPTEIGNFNVILEASDDEFSVKQEFEITVETVTGIDDITGKLSVHIYPNPVIHELHIDLSDFRNDETTISLFSMTGSLIFREEYKNIGGEVRIIKSVQQLRSGAYFLVIESEGYRKSYKIVKQ